MVDVSPQRWATLSPLLDELLDLDGAARANRLAQLRAQDAALASELSELLGQQHAVGHESFLEGTALDGPAGATLAGTTVGAYTLEAPIGAGGMGSVWLARRSDGRFEGRVAVKLLNLALVGRGGAQRFEREGSVLARLAHPNIARLLDAGVTPGGQPYLVLEHVEGEPIDRFCDRQGLGVEARVRLMGGVLAAVAHAHGRLVLHRDLKPSNILVTPDGTVKLLDFGIAKLLDDESSPAQATELTQLAGRAFTPDYAAPEQVQGDEVGTATDVYALGVLLFVLLGGTHPTARATHTPVQRLRSVVETEPQRLSDAAARTNPAAAMLRGDLDNIVAKALKKSPAERFPTAAAFADDLRRYLVNEPVLARPDAFGYRAAKFVRRHRLGVGAAAVTVAALVAGVIGTTWQAVEARRERDDALFQAERALAKGNLFNLMLNALGSADRPLTQREILERSVQLVEKQFGKDPRIAVDLLLPIAGQYLTLNDANNEFAVMQRAAKIAHASGDAQLLADVACNTVDTEVRRGRLAQAKEQLRVGREALARVSRPGVGLVAACLRSEADVAQAEGDLGRATAHIADALAHIESTGDTRGSSYRSLLSYMNLLHRARGDLAASYAVIKQEQRLDEEAGRTESIDYLGARREEALTLYAWGEVLPAHTIIESLVPRWRGMNEAGTAPTWFDSTRGVLMLRLGDAASAHTLLVQVAEREKAQGNVFAIVSGHFVLAQALLALGRPDDAEAQLRAMGGAEPGGAWRLTPATFRAQLLLARGNAAQALPLIEAELVRLKYPGAPPSLALAAALRVAAQVHLAAAGVPRAESLATAAVAVAEGVARDPAASADVGEALLTLARVQRSGHGDAAATAARASLALTGGLGPAHPLTIEARAMAVAGQRVSSNLR